MDPVSREQVNDRAIDPSVALALQAPPIDNKCKSQLHSHSKYFSFNLHCLPNSGKSLSDFNGV